MEQKSEGVRTAFVLCEPPLGGALREAFERRGVHVAGCDMTDGCDLDAIAPAAVAAVESTGGINWLLHCVRPGRGSTLFLDIDEAEWEAAFALHLRSLCASCKCVLPYLMCAENAGIYIMVADEASALPAHEEMCRRGKEGAIARMSAEFTDYGIAVTELRAPAEMDETAKMAETPKLTKNSVDEWADGVAEYITARR